MASGGGLLDLVARGKKDTFFTQNPKVSFIHSVYTKTNPSTQEIRITQPRNRPDWGHWVDFDIEFVGDIMRNPVLIIDLPTWLPPQQAKLNSQAITSDLSGVQYGYCQDVGALMIEKVQFYMDQYMVHEFWGQWLAWHISTQFKAPIFGKLGGHRTTDPLCKSATPKQLRVYLPILGNQKNDDKGFPLIALYKQNFRIRVHLRKLEEIIEASDNRINPMPWGKDFIQKTSNAEPGTNFKTLSRSQIPGPLIVLETVQAYIPKDAQEMLKKTILHVPFTQVQLCEFTIEDARWFQGIVPSDPVVMALPLDFVGAVTKLTVGVQSEANIRAGQRYNLSPPEDSLEFLQSLRFNTGTINRLNEWSSAIWRDLSNYYKNEREARDINETPLNIYTLTFGGRDKKNPTGTFNMSRTNTQVLYISLANISKDSRTNSRKSYVYVFAEAWNILEIKDGTAMLMFAD
jgi:hypothetical protein